MASENPYEGKTNKELQDILAKNDLPTSGNKDELLARLAEFDATQDTQDVATKETPEEADSTEAEALQTVKSTKGKALQITPMKERPLSATAGGQKVHYAYIDGRGWNYFSEGQIRMASRSNEFEVYLPEGSEMTAAVEADQAKKKQ